MNFLSHLHVQVQIVIVVATNTQISTILVHLYATINRCAKLSPHLIVITALSR